MKITAKFIILFGLIIGLVGCNTGNDESSEAVPNNGNTEATDNNTETDTNETEENTNGNTGDHALPQLEQQKTVKMMIEGMTEDKVVNVAHHKELMFSTYVPDDMIVESNPESFNVFTNFEGNRNENATLRITNKTEEQMTEEIETNGFMLEATNEKAYDFSEKEFSLKKEGMLGRAATFKHNGKDYSLVYYFPEDFADGFGPRADIIVNEIIWHDLQK